MRKTFIAATLASAALAAPHYAAAQAPAAAPASPHTVASNVGIVSDYLFRGISQSHGKPAVQGGVDYSHSSGFYLGAWGSSITWVKDWLGKGRTEIDLYGGYKNSFAGGDWNYDFGAIAYNYPGKGAAIATVLANPNTQEIYAGLGYKWLSAKYSYATSSHFIGWFGGTALNKNTRGSDYLELNANYDLGDGWTLIGHVGKQKVKDSVTTSGGVLSASYTDWKLGVSKDLGFGTVTLAYSDTDTSGTCTQVSANNTNPYCWGNGGFVAGTGPTSGFKDVSKGTAVLSFTKSF